MHCVAHGRQGDVKSWVSRARYEASQYKYKYGVAASPRDITEVMSDLAQGHTQKASFRPLAVNVVVGGAVKSDEGKIVTQLYKCDPAGHFMPYHGVAVGGKEQEAVGWLEKNMEDFGGYQEDEAVRKTIMCLGSVLGSDFKGSEIEVSVGKYGGWRKLTVDDVEGHLNAIAEMDA